jgi:hypothetical protein
MTLPGQVFGQDSITDPEAMDRSIAQPDLDRSRKRDRILAAARIVPIDECAGTHPAE